MKTHCCRGMLYSSTRSLHTTWGEKTHPHMSCDVISFDVVVWNPVTLQQSLSEPMWWIPSKLKFCPNASRCAKEFMLYLVDKMQQEGPRRGGRLQPQLLSKYFKHSMPSEESLWFSAYWAAQFNNRKWCLPRSLSHANSMISQTLPCLTLAQSGTMNETAAHASKGFIVEIWFLHSDLGESANPRFLHFIVQLESCGVGQLTELGSNHQNGHVTCCKLEIGLPYNYAIDPTTTSRVWKLRTEWSILRVDVSIVNVPCSMAPS